MISQVCCVKSAIARGYPIVEYVTHHEPLYDELIIAVAKDDPDGTNDAIRSVAGPKVKLVELDWGHSEQVSLRANHYNQIMAEIIPMASNPWVLKMDVDCFLHEKDFSKIKKLCEDNVDTNICMLEFDCITFRSSLKYVTPFENVWMRPLFKPNACMLLGDGHQPGVKLPPGEGKVLLVRDITFFHFGWMRDNSKQQRVMKEHWIDVGWRRRVENITDPDLLHGRDFTKFDYSKEKFSRLEERGRTKEDLPSVLQEHWEDWDFYTPRDDQFIPWLPYPYQAPFQVTPEGRLMIDPSLIANPEDIPVQENTRPF